MADREREKEREIKKTQKSELPEIIDLLGCRRSCLLCPPTFKLDWGKVGRKEKWNLVGFTICQMF